jgi:Domain of unknown function (4846)
MTAGTRSARVATAIALVLSSMTPAPVAAIDYLWLGDLSGFESIAERISPPAGYQRLPVAESSVAAWWRGLPLRERGSKARLFDGRDKANQDGVFAVLEIDVGSRDLQQCADAVIRLRAEYQLWAGCANEIAFAFTSGDRARWSDWYAGRRPVVSGNRVSWVQQTDPDASYASFRKFLDSVFTYAGSHSLARELRPVHDPTAVLPGDVFIQGGFPGHAVMVADVAENARGDRVFLLIQSYMPAQDVHVLANPGGRDSPSLPSGRLVTPEWTFRYTDLRRFAEPDCDGRTR